ncbi:hypothetical protein A3A38_04770 [Candidatus Kaiserbacteria bacterium RIFCSPLOWO2_01_FULL_53_17]|uniref:Uncharacterized protein n=1 Tax=Candidatus Kaiserbacteria bacterium RIFCSPLOWO2_01_FULL_53_17 TaxID=1798511 RepID=A0A1F6EHR5_9BACT|nr:MAG: hypothetical protein A3A38_04770 [Candidatus Kaiserbacteria bacterium RIFCSPLOWO2_01_FULL_53_17]
MKTTITASIRGRGNAAAKYMTSRTASYSIALTLMFAVIGGLVVPASFAHASGDEPSCWISASPSTVSYNGSTTLTWGSNDADSGWITDIGDVALSGSQTVYNITSTKTYTFTVYGNGQSSTCQTTVTVSGSGSGYGTPSCSIYPSQNNIQSGQSTTLNWTSQNAQSAHLSADGSVATNGSYTVYPNQTTTYTLTVYGYSGGSNQCQTTVYVTGSGYPYYNYPNYNYPYSTYPYNYYATPSCTITLGGYSYNQNQIYNQTATLSWSSYNATSAYITNIGSVAVNGAQAVYPQQNQNYTMTVYGSGGTATCQTYGAGYNYPYAYNYPSYTSPYLQLTQIPYTGLDLGPVGTTVYFLALAMFAIAGGYLVVYYHGGVLKLSFAQEVAQAARNQYRAVRSLIS